MTTLPNLDDLMRLARIAQREKGWAPQAAFHQAASPAVVVGLCERVRALEQERDDLRKQVRDANAAKELMSQSATKWRKLMDESLAALARVTSQRKDQPTQPSEATNE
jgi:hypothetical protein